MYLFVPPTRLVRHGGTDPLFSRTTIEQGVSLLRVSGSYRQIEGPSPEDLAAATEVYLGGHEYHVSNDTAAALTAAGYSTYLRQE